jgi:hypothetical protein
MSHNKPPQKRVLHRGFVTSRKTNARPDAQKEMRKRTMRGSKKSSRLKTAAKEARLESEQDVFERHPHGTIYSNGNLFALPMSSSHRQCNQLVTAGLALPARYIAITLRWLTIDGSENFSSLSQMPQLEEGLHNCARPIRNEAAIT